MKNKILLIIMGLFIFTGCGRENVNKTDEVVSEKYTPVSEDFFSMDTYMNITAYGYDDEKTKEAVIKAEDRINELDRLLSTGLADSEIYRLNESGKGEVSDETSFLLEKSFEISEKTDGAFNIMVYPLMDLWGFTTQNYKVPVDEEINELLEMTNINDIKYDAENKTIEFEKNGIEIDFGGIAKGFASDEAVRILKENGINSAFLSLGGNVWVLGSKTDGSDWRVGIQSPDSDGYIGVLEVSDKAVITSGGYERYFEENGQTYHHILNPADGKPANSGLKSVTIISEDGTLADGLSTALFVAGLEKAQQIWRDYGENFEAVLMTDEDEIYVTEGVASSFLSECDYNIISK